MIPDSAFLDAGDCNGTACSYASPRGFALCLCPREGSPGRFCLHFPHLFSPRSSELKVWIWDLYWLLWCSPLPLDTSPPKLLISSSLLHYAFKFCTLSTFWQCYLYYPSHISVLFCCPFCFERSYPDSSPSTACCFLSLFSSRPCDQRLDVKYPFLIWQFYGTCIRSPWILPNTSLSGDISKLKLLFCVAWLLSCVFRLHTLPLRNATIRLLSRPFCWCHVSDGDFWHLSVPCAFFFFFPGRVSCTNFASKGKFSSHHIPKQMPKRMNLLLLFLTLRCWYVDGEWSFS